MKRFLVALVACITPFFTKAVTNYYSASSGNLDNVNSWGTNTNGTGTHPSNFTTASQVFNIVNNANPTIGANWTVSGTGSKIIVGNSTATINFTIPSGFFLAGTIDVTNHGTLTISNTTLPTLGTLSTGSTLNFNKSIGGQTIPGTTYSNLTIGNTSGTQTAGGTITVNGVLTTTSGGTLAMSTFQLLGTLTSVANNGTITTLCTINPAFPASKSWGGTTGQATFASATGNQFIPGGTYKNLTCSNTSDTNTVVGNISSTGTFVISGAGGMLNMGANTLSANIVTNNGTLLTQNSSSAPLPSGKTWAGTVNYNGTGSQTIMDGVYTNLILSGTRSGSPVLTLANGTISVSGNFTNTSTGISGYSTGTNTFTYSASTGGQAVAGITYNNLTLSNTSGINTAGGNITVNGTLTTTAGGTLSLSTYQIASVTTITNNGTISTLCTVNPALPASRNWAGQVTFASTTGGQYIPQGTYQNLTCSNTSGTNTAVGSVSIGSAIVTSGVGGTLDMGANALSSNSVTNNGTLLTQSTSTSPLPSGKAWAGTVNYNGTGSQKIMAGTYSNLVLSGTRTSSPVITLENGTITVSGNFTNTSTGIGSYSTGTNAFIYSATAGGQTVGGITYNNLTLSNTSGTNTASGNIAVNGTLTTTSGGTLAMAANQLASAATVTNNGTITTLCTVNPALPASKSWSGTTGQVTFASATGNQFIPGGTYKGITCSNTSDTNTVVGTMSVTGTFITSGAAGLLNMGTNALSGSATITNNGTILTQNTSSAPLPTGKSWANTVNYNGTGNQTIVAGTYVNLALSGAHSSSTITLENGTIAVSGSFNNTASGISSYSPGTNTFVYSATTGGQTIGGITYNNLTLSNTSGTNTASGNITVNGALTTTSGGTLAMAANQLTSAATVTNNGTITTLCTVNPALPASKSWSGTTGQVTFASATGNQFIPGGTYKGITCSNTSDTNTVVGTMSVTGTFVTTAAGGTLNMGTSALSGSAATITNNGTILTQNTSSAPLPTGKSWANTVNYNGTGNQTIVAGTYVNLALSGAHSLSTITLENGTIAVSSTFNNTASGISSYSPGTNTFVYSATTGGQTIGGITYNNLTLSNTSGINTASGNITVNGALITTSGGTLAMATNQLASAATVTNNGTITTLCTVNPALPASKSWSGTTGQVTFASATGNQFIPGGTYKGITCSNTSDTNTVVGTMSVTGTFVTTAAGGTLNMGTSALSGSAATITNNGTILTQNTSSAPLPTGKSWANTVNYNGTGNQTIVAGTYVNLALSGTHSSSTLTLENGTIAVSGNFNNTSTGISTYSTGTNTFIYTSSGQTIGGITYNNLTLSKTSGTNTAGGNINVNGVLTTTSGGTLDMSSYQLSGTPTSVVNNGTITTLCTLNPALPSGKSWIGTKGIVTFASTTGGQYIPGGTYKTLTCSNTSDTNTVVGGTVTMTGQITTAPIGGTLDMGTNALALSGGSITNSGTLLTQNASSTPLPSGLTWAGAVIYNGTGNQTIVPGTYKNIDLSGTRVSTPTITLGSGTISISASFSTSYTGDVTFSNAGNTVTYTGNTTQTIGGIDYNNLTLSNTGSTKTAEGNISVAGTLTTTSGGKLAMDVYQLSGALTSVVNNGTITTNCASNPALPVGKSWGGTTGLVTFGATTGGQYIPGGTYKTLTCSNTSDTNFVTGGDLNVTGTLTTSGTGGTLDMGTNALTATTITISSTGTVLTQNTSSAPLPSGRSFSGLINYNGSGNQTIVAGTYSNLSLSGTRISTPAITLASGTIALSGSFTVAYSGNVSFVNTGNTFTYTANSSQTVGGISYNNLTLTNTTSTKTAGGNISVGGALTTASGGTLAMSTYQLSGVLTSVTNNGTITTASTANPAIPSGKNWSGTTGAVTFSSGTGRQYIPSGTYKTLTCSNTSDTNTAAGNIKVTGTITTTGSNGTLDMGTNELSAATITNNSSGKLLTQCMSATPFPSGMSFAGTVYYNALAGGQTIMAGTYKNLSLTNPTGIDTVTGDLVVNAALATNGGTLDMGEYALSGSSLALFGEGTILTANTTAAPLRTGRTWSQLIVYDNPTGGQTVVNGTYSGGLTNSNTSGTNTVATSSTITVNGDLTLSAGSELDDNGTSIALNGNILGTGTHLVTTGGRITMNSGGSISGATLGNLRLNNSTGFSLTGDATVNGTLTLNAGTLTLGRNNLILGLSAPAIAGTFSSAKMIVTDDSGQVRKLLEANDTCFFPVGDTAANYTPITLVATGITYGDNAYVGARVVNAHHSMDVSATNYLKRYWNVSTANITSPSHTVLSAKYVDGDVVGDESNITAAQYMGVLPWVKYSTVNAASNIVSVNGLTSNSDISGIPTIVPSVFVLPFSSSICNGGNVVLDATGDGIPPFTYSWSPSTGLSATTGASVTAAPTTSGSVSATYIYTVTITDGNGNSSTAISSVTVMPLPPAITGSNSVCEGATTALNNSFPSGTWSSADESIATIGNNDGIMTGIASGNTTITYLFAGGCLRTVNVTVNPLPDVNGITGSSVLCENGTTSLGNTTIGGAWSSGDEGIATIDENTGLVSGVSGGGATITYNMTSSLGCSASVTRDVTVNPLPHAAAITGPASVCVASAITLSNVTADGVWSSTNPSIATVDSFGVVSGVLGDTTVDITYVAINGCGTDTATATVTVNALPTVGTISYTNNHKACPGQQWLYTSTHTDGVWSTSDTSIATIDSTGMLTAISDGIVSVSYTVTSGNGCSKSRLTGLTVNPLPLVSPIDGVGGICPGSTLALTNASTDGSHTWTSANLAVATVTPGSGVVTGITSGTVTVSYNYTVQGCTSSATAVVTVNAASAPVIGGANTICAGSTTTLTVDSVGGVWYTADVAEVSVDSATGAVTGITAGTAIITYAFTNSFGCFNIVTRTLTVNALPSAAAIGGASSVCVGATATLTEVTTGGVWSSGNTAIAAVGTSGIITGVDAGTTFISYTVTGTNGCSKSVTRTVTVSALPGVAAIAGSTGNVCRGNTLTLTNASGGTHVWSSDNTAVATINSSTGALTAVAIGTATISYRYTATCINYATMVITVNPVTTASVSGTSLLCSGSSIAFIGAPADGTWSSSSASRASVGSVSGIVTGGTTGSAAITYTYTNSYSCISKAYTVVTVIAQPSVAAIGGVSSACAGVAVTLTEATSGGVWSSSNALVGSIDNTTGAVAALSAGTTTISYTVTGSNGCSKTVTKTFVVNALPTVSAIVAGTGTVCQGTTLGLTNATSGSHVWTSDNSSVATVNSSTGVVTGVAAGTAVISYKYTLVCNNYAQTVVTVNPAVTPTITGTAAVCAGSTTALTGAPADGIWVSGSVSKATVNTVGVVTGVASGTSILTYTHINSYGCTGKANKTVTVNAIPTVASIGGASSVCQGAVTTLVNGTSGGVWSSANMSVATVGTNGAVSGVSAGAASVSYTVTNSAGCIKSVSKTMVVNALPSVAPIFAGLGTVNEGATISLTNASVGTHVWSSGNTSIATVNASTGVVTGIEEGTVVISYAYTLGCTNYATTVVTVNYVSGKPEVVSNVKPEVTIQVYPNPTTGTFNVKTEGNGQMMLYTLEGKEIAQYTIAAGSNTLSIPGGVPAGVYMCMFGNNNGEKVMVRLVYEP